MPVDQLHLDLRALIEQRSGISLARVSNTAGGEYAGSCPWCFGKDRFRVWPFHDSRPHFWCRGCSRGGDSIAFLMQHEDLSFKQALVELELAEEDYVPPMLHTLEDPPPPAWQSAAADFVDRTERYLWHPKSPEGQQALDYLHSRGLTDETIRSAKLGYCPLARAGTWYTDSLEHWGLKPEQTTKDVVRVPDGVVIPWFWGNDLWKICIKRPWAREGELRYGQVVGSGEGLYGVDSQFFQQETQDLVACVATGSTSRFQYSQADRGSSPQEHSIILVEGEFDCLSVCQEARDIITCVATGSVSRGRTKRWISLLSQASLVLQSFDSDQAGDDGARFWLENIPKAIRWKPWAKDPSQMLQDGQNVRSWVELGIPLSTPCKGTTEPLQSQIEVSGQPDDVLSGEPELCSFCDRPIEFVDEICGEIVRFCDICWRDHQARLNMHRWLGKPCPVVNESKGKVHGVYETITVDQAGYCWCDRCWHQPRLMNWGVALNFMSFYFQWNGKTVFVEEGQENWFRFACHAGYAQVWLALETVKKLGQPKQQEAVYDF